MHLVIRDQLEETCVLSRLNLRVPEIGSHLTIDTPEIWRNK